MTSPGFVPNDPNILQNGSFAGKRVITDVDTARSGVEATLFGKAAPWELAKTGFLRFISESLTKVAQAVGEVFDAIFSNDPKAIGSVTPLAQVMYDSVYPVKQKVDAAIEEASAQRERIDTALSTTSATVEEATAALTSLQFKDAARAQAMRDATAALLAGSGAINDSIIKLVTQLAIANSNSIEANNEVDAWQQVSLANINEILKAQNVLNAYQDSVNSYLAQMDDALLETATRVHFVANGATDSTGLPGYFKPVVKNGTTVKIFATGRWKGVAVAFVKGQNPLGSVATDIVSFVVDGEHAVEDSGRIYMRGGIIYTMGGISTVQDVVIFAFPEFQNPVTLPTYTPYTPTTYTDPSQLPQ